MKNIISTCAVALVPVLLVATSFTKDKAECPFTRISPIPEGKAVIYLYKDGYGRQPSAISVNEKIVVVIKNKGYYPLVVEPGEYAFETGSGFGWAPMGHPVNKSASSPEKNTFSNTSPDFQGASRKLMKSKASTI